jgi:hypothetical protein
MALTIDGSDPSGDLGDLLDDKLAVATAVSDYLPIAGGKVLQVVRATDTTNRTTTSTTYVDVTGMSVTITPQKSTSAVILVAVVSFAGSSSYGALQITDSSNNAISGAQENFLGDGSVAIQTTMNIWGYATPGTTSAVTYKLRTKTFLAGTVQIKNGEATGQLYAIEVSA